MDKMLRPNLRVNIESQIPLPTNVKSLLDILYVGHKMWRVSTTFLFGFSNLSFPNPDISP